MGLRHELAVPFRGLHPRHALAGSAVLIGAIRRGLGRILRVARKASASTSGRPAPAADAVKLEKTAATDGPAPASRSAGDRAEQIGIAVLAAVPVLAAVGAVLPLVGNLLAPYAPGIVFSVLALWYLTAAAVAPRAQEQPETTPENDHEKSAGEQHQEEDLWPRRREAIRQFVEHEVAAGAGGYREAKGRGARVDDLTARLFAEGTPDGWDRRTTLDLLERCGIRVREQMKFRLHGKQKNHPGVHVDDLTQDLGRTPRLPPYLVPDLTPGAPSTLTPDTTPQQHPDTTPQQPATINT